MLVTAYLDGVNLVCLCSVVNGRGRVWRWWWWVALTRYHVVRNWCHVIRWELNSSCVSADSCGLGPLLCLPWQLTGVSMGGGTHPLLAHASPSRYPHLLSTLLIVLVCWLGHLVGPG